MTALNIRLVTHGTLPDDNLSSAMFVANHVSWTDIFALNSVRPLRFVAKSEIRSWPMFGWLCEKGNTLFVERTKRQDAGRMVELTADCLRAAIVCAFSRKERPLTAPSLKLSKAV